MASHTRSLVASLAREKCIKVECTLTINRPVEELYRFWRNLENQSVQMLDEVRSHWVLFTTASAAIKWDATIHNEIPNELIAWSSLPDAQVKVSGSVHFRPAPTGRGTLLRVGLSYDSPTGKVSRLLARLLGKDPSLQLRSDLRRFKALLETGEIPTIEGQPSGRWEARKRTAAFDPLPNLAGSLARDTPASVQGRMS